MFKALANTISIELSEIRASYYKLLLVTLLPLFSFALVIAIFYKGVAVELPIVVVDNDKSELSRELLFNVNASATLNITSHSLNVKDALELVSASKAYGVLVIPPNFQRETLLKSQPKVTAMLNTQYILIGKILTAALSESVAYSAGEVEFVESLASTQSSVDSLHSLSPIAIQVTPFFNTYKNYFLFLVSALLPSIWQIFIVIATIVSFGTLFKAQKEREFFKKEHFVLQIIGKILPYTVVYTLMGVLFLFYIYGTLGWCFEGSFGVTIFGMFLTVVAYQVIALLFFVTGFDYARALSLGAVYTAPAFAFLGVTFPVYNMNGFALFWRDMLPISHYMELQISQANYGADIFLEIDKLLVLLTFWLLFIPVIIRFKSRLGL
ncbi:MAG: ABC transporter permease [Campylobacterota bacterium]|nr:ABC transporter permease [Campylobacterota bacterium]